jgi:hypothetical protein
LTKSIITTTVQKTLEALCGLELVFKKMVGLRRRRRKKKAVTVRVAIVENNHIAITIILRSLVVIGDVFVEIWDRIQPDLLRDLHIGLSYLCGLDGGVNAPPNPTCSALNGNRAQDRTKLSWIFSRDIDRDHRVLLTLLLILLRLRMCLLRLCQDGGGRGLDNRCGLLLLEDELLLLLNEALEESGVKSVELLLLLLLELGRLLGDKGLNGRDDG